MKTIKIICFFVIVLFVLALTLWGVPQEKKDTAPKKVQQETTVKEKPQQEQKDKDEADADDVSEAMSKRLEEGDSMFKILGIPEPEDYMPTTFEMFLLWLLPVGALVGITLLIIILTKRRHQRMLAMIEKGIAPGTSDSVLSKLPSFRWDVFVLLTGLILSFGGLGFSIFSMGQQGVQKWYTGVIPLLLGVAFLIFYFIYYKPKK